MLGRLYEFQIATWGARYKTYAAIFLITVSYGVLNSEVLGRSEQRVSYECLALTLLLMISLPILGPSIAKLKEGILSREDRIHRLSPWFVVTALAGVVMFLFSFLWILVAWFARLRQAPP